MPLKDVDFTVRVIGENPHRKGTDNWRAGQIVEAMEGCHVSSILSALRSFEENRIVGVADPARWLSHFAGLESASASKKIEPWIEVLHGKQPVQSRASYRELVKKECS
ncbi:hypothetical protein [Haliea atlantica]